VGANHQVASPPHGCSVFAERRHNDGGDCRRFSSAAQPAQPIIAGSDDSTLLSQVKLLRTESNDRLDRLNQLFERFAEKVVEANSKALIQALTEVIKDFNVKLNDQFGENFKSLNAAVERLVVWQKQYEQQLNALIEQETMTRKSMTESSLRYTDLVNKSTVFTTTAESLRDLLVGNKARSQQLYASLWSLADLMTEFNALLKTTIETAKREFNGGIQRETEDSKNAGQRSR
jgi:hypothetical protein